MATKVIRSNLLCPTWVYEKTRRTNTWCSPPSRHVMCIKSQYHMSRNGHIVTSKVPMFCHQHVIQYGTVSFIRIFISYILLWDTTHTIHHVTDKNSVFVDHSVYYKWMTTVVHVLWNLAFSGFNHWMRMYMCYQLRIFKKETSFNSALPKPATSIFRHWSC